MSDQQDYDSSFVGKNDGGNKVGSSGTRSRRNEIKSKKDGSGFNASVDERSTPGGKCGPFFATRSKPAREIYRPPGVRTKGHGGRNSHKSEFEDFEKNGSFPAEMGSNSGSNSTSSGCISTKKIANNDKSYLKSPKPSKKFFSYDSSMDNDSRSLQGAQSYGHKYSSNGYKSHNRCSDSNRKLNVNAKEFHYNPSISHCNDLPYRNNVADPISTLTSGLFDGVKTYYENHDSESPILATSGCYPLKQSKSWGNVNLILQQQSRTQINPLATFVQQQQSQYQSNFCQIISKTSVGQDPRNLGLFAKPFGSSGYIAPVPSTKRMNDYFSSVATNQQDANRGLKKLCQSKSSGNVPFGNRGKSRVKFENNRILLLDSDDEEDDDDDDFENRCLQMGKQHFKTKEGESISQSLEESMSSFNLGNDGSGKRPGSLQKCKTVHFTNRESTVLNSSRTDTCPDFSKTKSGFHHNVSNPGVIKRSRSFGPDSKSRWNGGILGREQAPSDFAIKLWPPHVQGIVVSAMTGEFRKCLLIIDKPGKFGSREKIAMCNEIFKFMLKGISTGSNKVEEIKMLAQKQDNISQTSIRLNVDPKKSLSSPTQSTFWNQKDLAVPAAHIFLYFIQRESDRTIMESMLNISFATFQNLNTEGKSKKEKTDSRRHSLHSATDNTLPYRWSLFLKFLSSLYSQAKMIRLQKLHQHSNTDKPVSLEELSFSLLSLICDTCLGILRNPSVYTAQTMECLFSVMTSIGRDMEGTFPSKMKQLLAAVRDALLGLGPYSSGAHSVLPNVVQKTLMQLIELHAANWHLPASAVRYYYYTTSAPPPTVFTDNPVEPPEVGPSSSLSNCSEDEIPYMPWSNEDLISKEKN